MNQINDSSEPGLAFCQVSVGSVVETLALAIAKGKDLCSFFFTSNTSELPENNIHEKKKKV